MDSKTNEQSGLKMPQPALEPALKYADIIGKSEADKDKEQLDLWVSESKMNIEGDILSTRKELQVAKRNLAAEKSKKPLNPKAVIEANQKVRSLENGISALEDLKEELF